MTNAPTPPEFIILVDEQNREIGLSEKLAAHQENLLHRAFSVFLFREAPKRELLLQQRAMGKYHCPGLWTNTCCSHPNAGENIINAGQRRVFQELGIHAELRDIGWFHYNAHFSNGLSENEIDHVLIGTVDNQIKVVPNPAEILDYRWVTIEELESVLIAEPEKFTPWLKQALRMVKKVIEVNS
jgi:isopentenyl-diphosphate delta-isomerase